MIGYHASWIVPISGPPIRDGWVVLDGGRVRASGAPTPGAAIRNVEREVDLGHVAIMPGLVNAHTHLELSHLEGRVPAGGAFVEWIRTLLAERRRYPDPSAPEIVQSAERAIAEACRCGTAVVGDISNTLVTVALLARSSLAALVFYELFGFNTATPVELVERARERIDGLQPIDRVRVSLAAHAPYSVASGVFEAMWRSLERDGQRPCSVHLSESRDELEFVRTGSGPCRVLLEELGVWNPAWVPPGVSPVQYVDRTGFLRSRTLAVHGVQATPADLATLVARQATLVTCPRSNAHTGAGRPPIEAFYESGVRVAIGTDSLASTPDLNLFSELAEMRALAPTLPAGMLLDSATRQGAQALAFDDYGTIEPGQHARLIAVDTPPGINDVEEYLVSGIQSEQVRWIEE